MCYEVDELYSVYDEQNPKARKEHKCQACGETIKRKHTYWSVGALFEGRWETIVRCERCQYLHQHLRGLGDLWPDERLNCGETYQQVWGEEPPDDITALAFVTQDEMQRMVPHATD